MSQKPQSLGEAVSKEIVTELAALTRKEPAAISALPRSSVVEELHQISQDIESCHAQAEKEIEAIKARLVACLTKYDNPGDGRYDKLELDEAESLVFDLATVVHDHIDNLTTLASDSQ